MCEICRKYKCPDGCPNNYTPTRRPKRERRDKRVWSFNDARLWQGLGGAYEKCPPKAEKNNKT